MYLWIFFLFLVFLSFCFAQLVVAVAEEGTRRRDSIYSLTFFSSFFSILFYFLIALTHTLTHTHAHTHFLTVKKTSRIILSCCLFLFVCCSVLRLSFARSLLCSICRLLLHARTILSIVILYIMASIRILISLQYLHIQYKQKHLFSFTQFFLFLHLLFCLALQLLRSLWERFCSSNLMH